MSSSAEEKVLILKSKEGDEFIVKESVIAQSPTIKNLIGDGCASNAIPITNLDSKTLAMVLEYLNTHGDAMASEADKNIFDSEFVKKEEDDLFSLILAANYLNIRGLLDLVAQAIANAIKDFTMEEVRSYLGLERDFTPEEEEAICKENPWAFD